MSLFILLLIYAGIKISFGAGALRYTAPNRKILTSFRARMNIAKCSHTSKFKRIQLVFSFTQIRWRPSAFESSKSTMVDLLIEQIRFSTRHAVEQKKGILSRRTFRFELTKNNIMCTHDLWRDPFQCHFFTVFSSSETRRKKAWMANQRRHVCCCPWHFIENFRDSPRFNY